MPLAEGTGGGGQGVLVVVDGVADVVDGMAVGWRGGSERTEGGGNGGNNRVVSTDGSVAIGDGGGNGDDDGENEGEDIVRGGDVRVTKVRSEMEEGRRMEAMKKEKKEDDKEKIIQLRKGIRTRKWILGNQTNQKRGANSVDGVVSRRPGFTPALVMLECSTGGRIQV